MSKHTPMVSVIIPAFNCALYLGEALDSIFQQTYQDFEIILLDDGSVDNTKDLVASYIQNYSEKLKYIYQENQGLAIARNKAIQNAKGKYIALLDADDIWLPEHLSYGVDVLERKDDVGLCHANITRIDEGGKIIRTPKRDKKFLSGYIFENIFLRKANVSVPTIIFRKACIEKVGGFDEHLARLGCEDREFCLRISKEYRIFYINEVLAYYRERSNSMSHDLTKMLKARYYVINKHAENGKLKLFLKEKALANVHKEIGDVFLLRGFFSLAVSQYRKSIQYWPLTYWAWVNFVKSLFKLLIK